MVAEFRHHVRPTVAGTLAEDDERDDRLAGGGVGGADDRGLGHLLVGDERRLDLRGRDAVARHVHDVVDAAEQPDVAVVILLGAVAGEVEAVPPGPVGLLEPFRVAPDAAEHRRPGLGEHHVATAPVRHGLGIVVDDVGADARQRPHRGTRLARGDARERADHDRAGLRLPPGVDDWGPVAADHAAVPDPGLRVDVLADGPEQPDLRQVELRGDVLAPLHEGADRGRRGVEDRHAVLLRDLPPATLVRGVRRALVHDRRRAVRERPVDDVGVAGDPADVGGAPVDVGVGLDVEDVAVRVRALRQVAAGGVQDALGLAGRARGVEQVERVLGVERLGGVLVRG